MRSYKEFESWRQSTALLQQVYQVAALLPKYEEYGFASQMRRSALSIPCNIAEGFAKNSLKEFRRYSRISYGSAMELESQIELAHRLGLISEQHMKILSHLIDHVLRLLNGQIASLNRKIREDSINPPRTKH